MAAPVREIMDGSLYEFYHALYLLPLTISEVGVENEQTGIQ
jgi:hypothetical protein